MADDFDDISKDVAAAMESVSSTADAPSPPGATQESAAPPSEPSDGGKASDGERARDDKGRFAAKTETPKPAAQENTSKAPGETPTGAQAAAPQTQQPTQPQRQRLAPPSNWKGAGKVVWDKLPYEVQQELSGDYGNFSKANDELSRLKEAIGNRSQNWALQYGSVENGLKAILAGADMANQNPRQFLAWFLQRSGINPAELIQGMAQGQQQPTLDAQNPLAQEVMSLRNTVNQFLQQQQQTTTASLQSELDAFANDPAHPYFNDVRQDMGALMSAGRAKTLQEAYEMAVWAHPEVRQTLIEKERQSIGAANAAAVAAAKRAAGGPTGSPAGGSMPPDEPDLTLEAEITRNWERVRGKG